MVHVTSVEWSLGKSPELIAEVWATGALVEAVLGALLAEPEALAKAMRALQGAP